jgi:hypothetical protein
MDILKPAMFKHNFTYYYERKMTATHDVYALLCLETFFPKRRYLHTRSHGVTTEINKVIV